MESYRDGFTEIRVIFEKNCNKHDEGKSEISKEDEVKVSLVSAKARVAPVQRPAIPRLELLGATIGARIALTILETLKLTLKTYFWTDSMTVLGWITNLEPWNAFVGNSERNTRIDKCRSWRFVPGDLNPADLPSRLCD
ncbi:uncharacterized protein TNCV_4770931 [Trichonephila clavipes]|nr:uncharacterized protein TNCV_4770931 [Trichonephila clavipes]